MSELSSIDVAVSPLDKFREYLSTQGKRLTQEKTIVVDEVFSSHEHFDRAHIIDRLTRRGDGKRVSPATIHRALNELEEAGLIRKVAQADNRDIYEHDYGYPHHDHLICRECNTLIEFENDRFEPILEQIAAKHGFLMEGHRMEVYGICEDCRRPPRRRHRKLEQI